MSKLMRCENCGRAFYSASATVLVAEGDRCSECGGRVVVVEEAPESGSE